MFYTIVFTLWLISPANETFEGVVEWKWPDEVCLDIVESWASEPLALNIKRAEFRCVPVIDISPFMENIMPFINENPPPPSPIEEIT